MVVISPLAMSLSRKMTLSQTEGLLLVQKGRKRFQGGDGRSIGTLVDKDLVTANFDLSDRDPLRGRVQEIWHSCEITNLGEQVAEALRDRFSTLFEKRSA